MELQIALFCLWVVRYEIACFCFVRLCTNLLNLELFVEIGGFLIGYVVKYLNNIVGFYG